MASRIRLLVSLFICLHIGPAELFPSVQNFIPKGGVSPQRLLENLESEEYSGHRIDLVASHRRLHEVLADLEEAAGIHFELDPSIDDRVTYRMLDVPWDEALSAVLSDHSLSIGLNLEGIGFKIGRGETVVLALDDPGRARLVMFLYNNLEWIIGGIFLLLAVAVIGLRLSRTRLARRRVAPKKPLLSPEDVERTKTKLFYLLDVERIYRDEGTTLQVLAGRLAVSTHQLSWLLNEELRQTFSSLINGYRVEEVKRRLSDPHLNRTSILQVGLEAGFNTKASFNRAFKRDTGMTPSQFKKNVSP